jgi:hypothetical protein
VNQNGNKIPDLYVALLNPQNHLVDDGFTDVTFTLEAERTYIVEMGDFYNAETETAYEFERWQDSSTDSMTRMVNAAEFGEDNAETFTALYSVAEDSTPPVDDGNDDETTGHRQIVLQARYRCTHREPHRSSGNQRLLAPTPICIS